jgi:hypothetical protein
MRGMRNKVIHNYFDVNLSVVWNTTKVDLSRLKQQIDHLMKQQEATREVVPPTGKDAKKPALAQMRTETEQSIQQGQEPKQDDRDR